MATDTAGFRRVLHEWARQQLEEKSGHVGPFDIVHVELDHDSGSSMSSETTSVVIRFKHDGHRCEESWRLNFIVTDTGSRAVLAERCVMESWYMPDTTATVKMLNELLAIADE